jgi:hypothetical protein
MFANYCNNSIPYDEMQGTPISARSIPRILKKQMLLASVYMSLESSKTSERTLSISIIIVVFCSVLGRNPIYVRIYIYIIHSEKNLCYLLNRRVSEVVANLHNSLQRLQ